MNDEGLILNIFALDLLGPCDQSLVALLDCCVARQDEHALVLSKDALRVSLPLAVDDNARRSSGMR